MNTVHRRILAFALLGFLSIGMSGHHAYANDAGAAPDVETIVRKFHVNYSSGEVEKNGLLVADDIVVNLNGGEGKKPNGATYKGRAAFVEWLKADRVVFPDAKLTDHDVVVSGNTAAIRFTLVGTHGGSLPTPEGILPATGRKVVLEAMEFFTFNSEGQVTRIESVTNDLGLLAQLSAKE